MFIDPAAQNYDRVSVSCDAFVELNFNRDITFIFEPRTHESIGDSAVESTPESSPPHVESPPPVRHRLVCHAHLPRLSFFSSPSPPPEPDADIGLVGLATTDSPPPLRRPLPRCAHLPRLSLLPSPSPPPEPDADFSPLEPATTNSPPPLCSELAMPELVDAPPGSSLEDDSISQSSDSPPAYSRTPTPFHDFLAMFSDALSPVHASSPPPWILDNTEAQVETLSEGEEQRHPTSRLHRVVSLHLMPASNKVECHCKSYGCNGGLISYDTFRTHRARDLREQCSQPYRPRAPISSAPLFQIPVVLTGPIQHTIDTSAQPFPTYLPSTGHPNEIEQEMLVNGTMSVSNLMLDVPWQGAPPAGPLDDSGVPMVQRNPDLLLQHIDYWMASNSMSAVTSQPLSAAVAHQMAGPSPDEESLMRELQSAMEEAALTENGGGPEFLGPPTQMANVEDEMPNPDKDVEVAPPEPWSELIHLQASISQTGDVDDPDPFHCASSIVPNIDIAGIAPHLVSIYALVCWLHLQHHLPRSACNVVLWAFALIIVAVSQVACPGLPYIVPALPVLTLKTASSLLGLEVAHQIFVVCPNCKEVFPDTSDLSDNSRKTRIPEIKYPYLSLEDQLRRLLQIPGLEDLLDDWRKKPQTPGVLINFFDGGIAKDLQGPDGKQFFANNGIQDAKGPDGELRIGLSWGVDW
ncbi:hypothetical protein A0H81_00066 [Grifola frondosa]|uniref:Post-SET domain-containing protein n=1 Tax=Grifola frondosa TaxID=5627 RepID=A0A1C7MPT9_GRIFR|nr:hypothetical protein A0H81_00066 [Grifola frondosa]